MNLSLLVLGIYLTLTGICEIYFPKRLEIFFETCFRAKHFRFFSLWAFAIGLLAYWGVPANGFKWFIIFLVWLYGVLGLWILIQPELFRRICQKTYFDSPGEMRYKMTRFDGMMRFVIAFLVFAAAF